METGPLQILVRGLEAGIFVTPVQGETSRAGFPSHVGLEQRAEQPTGLTISARSGCGHLNIQFHTPETKKALLKTKYTQCLNALCSSENSLQTAVQRCSWDLRAPWVQGPGLEAYTQSVSGLWAPTAPSPPATEVNVLPPYSKLELFWFWALSRSVNTIFFADQKNKFQVDLETTFQTSHTAMLQCSSLSYSTSLLLIVTPQSFGGEGACKPPAAERAEMPLTPFAFL